MKEKMKRLSELMKTIFGYGIMLTLFVGALTFFAYVAALIIGGDTAVKICDFIFNTVIKYMIYANNILLILGIIAMYFAGEKALTPSQSKKSETD